MSRVFVAHENALGRTVVVKVIAPELAEGVSAERFAREVKLAARLQQANIVPVLSIGSSGCCRTTRCHSCPANRCARAWPAAPD